MRRTVRELSLGSGLTLTAYVVDGAPAGGLAQPSACLGARTAAAHALAAGESEVVQRIAALDIALRPDTAPDLQTLMLQLARTGHQGWSGAGLPTWSQRPLHAGLALSGSAGNGRSHYLAIAAPRATHVAVHAPAPFTVPVVQGFYGLILPRHTGRVTLAETAADGTVVATRSLR
jgi:hypothetical protein